MPVVVDCDQETWNMDVNQIEEKITSRTKAIMVVHIYGLPVDMGPVLDIAGRHGLNVIEDAAQAHGLSYRGEERGAGDPEQKTIDRPCGSFGDISTFSFYPNKLITTGEGGMIVTDNGYLAERCRSLRNLCFQAERRFVHEELGWNYRMSNIQAALGVAQLERLGLFIERKRAIGKRYSQLLSDIKGIQRPLMATSYAKNGYWVYGLVMNGGESTDAEEAMRRLRYHGVGTRPFFWPMHEQPVFRKMGLFGGQSCPVAEHMARFGFYIPSGLSLTDEQMVEVSDALHEVIK